MFWNSLISKFYLISYFNFPDVHFSFEIKAITLQATSSCKVPFLSVLSKMRDDGDAPSLCSFVSPLPNVPSTESSGEEMLTMTLQLQKLPVTSVFYRPLRTNSMNSRYATFLFLGNTSLIIWSQSQKTVANKYRESFYREVANMISTGYSISKN